MNVYLLFAGTILILTLIVTAVAVIRSRKGLAGSLKALDVIGNFIDKYHIVFLLLIFLVFLASRILKIESFPNGIHVDELSIAADAKSIMYYGTDRWGINYPAYFQNYGGGQNSLYIYIESFLLHFMPCTIFTLRIQAVFWGAVCFFAVFGICYELMGNKGYALIGPALVTILPVCIMSQRWALESYQFLPFSAIVLYLIIRAVKTGKVADWIASGLFLGASLYTYAISYIVWPVFIVLGGLYLIRIKRITVRQAVAFVIPLAVLALPLILFQLVNFGILQPFKLGISDYLPLPVAREEEVSLSAILRNFRFYGKLFLGGEELTYNSFAEFGTIYMFLIPFVIAGLVITFKETILSFREKEYSPYAVVLFFWIGATVSFHIVKYPNVNRVNEIFVPYILFIAVAIYRLLNKRAFALIWMGVSSAASFVFFMYFYFFMQNAVYGYHPMFTNASLGKAIVRCEQSYLKDADTHIYIQYEDVAIEPGLQAFYFAGSRGEKYSDEVNTYGNVTAGLPEEIDPNENAIFIIGSQWPHITSYLISEGFIADQTLPGYSILFKVN